MVFAPFFATFNMTFFDDDFLTAGASIVLDDHFAPVNSFTPLATGDERTESDQPERKELGYRNTRFHGVSPKKR
jgi:hypothetical protein